MDRRAFVLGSLVTTAFMASPRVVWGQGEGSRREIVLGQSADLSGMSQNLGRDYFTGAKIALDQANAAGGVLGRRLRLVQLDDAGDAAQTAANTKRLIEEEKVDLLFGFTGEANVEAAIATAAFRDSDIELFAPLSGADHPGAKGRAIYLRPSFVEEMGTIFDRFGKMSLGRMTLVHTVSPSAVAARDAALTTLRARHMEAPKVHVLKGGANDVPAVMQRMQNEFPQAVVVLADTVTAAVLIKSLRKVMPGLFICLMSTVDMASVQQIVGPQSAQGLMVSRVVPDPLNGVVPVVAHFRKALTKYLDEAPTAIGLEGYIAGQALLAVLRKAESPRRLVAVAQRRVGELDLGGWKIDLARNRASEAVQIAMVSSDGRLI